MSHFLDSSKQAVQVLIATQVFHLAYLEEELIEELLHVLHGGIRVQVPHVYGELCVHPEGLAAAVPSAIPALWLSGLCCRRWRSGRLHLSSDLL